MACPTERRAALIFNNATMDFYAANILVQNGGTLQATGIGANGETLTIHLYGDPGDAGVTCQKLVDGIAGAGRHLRGSHQPE